MHTQLTNIRIAMILEQQQAICNSESRYTLISSQWGAGSTSALILKMVSDLIYSRNKFGVLFTKTDLLFMEDIIKPLFGKVRVSPISGMVTISTNNGDVKIKVTKPRKFKAYCAIDSVGYDHTFESSEKDILDFSSKINIVDRFCAFISHNKYSNLYCEKDGFKPFVSVFKMKTEDNIHLSTDYLKNLSYIDQESYSYLFSNILDEKEAIQWLRNQN